MEITKELKDKFRETCKEIVYQEGACKDINCHDCPGRTSNNNNIPCGIKGNTFVDFTLDLLNKDESLLIAAQKWLEDNPEDFFSEDNVLLTKVQELYKKSKIFENYMITIIKDIEKEIIKSAEHKKLSLEWDFINEKEINYISNYFTKKGFTIQINAGFVGNRIEIGWKL